MQVRIEGNQRGGRSHDECAGPQIPDRRDAQLQQEDSHGE